MQLDSTIFIAVITAITSIMGAWLVFKKETKKVDEQYFQDILERSRDLDRITDQRLNELGSKNKKLEDDITQLGDMLIKLKTHFMLMSKRYAAMEARVKKLSDIAMELIEQISQNGMEPIYDENEVKRMVDDAEKEQRAVCDSCTELFVHNATGGTNKINHQEILT